MKNVLVLGSDGLVGQTVYTYLHFYHPLNIFGSSRKKNRFFYLSVESFENDLNNITQDTKKIDYIINCIGELSSDNGERLKIVNSLFPHQLEKYCSKKKINLIHISTDAVFNKLAGNVYEDTSASPDTEYGQSKLKGEVTMPNCLTIRTSFVGIDKINHKGYLEGLLKVKQADENINRLWSGCTTLQFSELCNELIYNKLFDKVIKRTNIIHFVPLGPLPRFKVAQTFTKLVKHKIKIQLDDGEKYTRQLRTHYFDLLNMGKYNNNTHSALKEIIIDQNAREN